MRTLINVIICYLLSTALLSAGVTYKDWQFWVIFVLCAVLVSIQYIYKEG